MSLECDQFFTLISGPFRILSFDGNGVSTEIAKSALIDGAAQVELHPVLFQEA